MFEVDQEDIEVFEKLKFNCGIFEPELIEKFKNENLTVQEKTVMHYMSLLYNYYCIACENSMKLKTLKRNSRFLKYKKTHGEAPKYRQLIAHFRDEKPLESNQCMLCRERQTNTVFLPCGHCCCEFCTGQLRDRSDYVPLPSSVEGNSDSCFALGLIAKKMFLCPFCRGVVSCSLNFFP